MNDRKIVKVNVSTELLETILSGQSGVESGYRIETDAPKDLRIVQLSCEGYPPISPITMYCQSESFRELREGRKPR